MDSSNTGKISRQSWSRALDPLYAAIVSIGRCLRHVFVQQSDQMDPVEIFKSFDEDSNGKLTREEFSSRLLNEMCQKNLNCPESHVISFHTHLTFFSGGDGDADSVCSSHWIAALELINCEVVLDTDMTDYFQIFLRSKQSLATDQLAALVLRPFKNQGMLTVLASMDSKECEIDVLKVLRLEMPFEELQWHLICQYGGAMPDINSTFSESRGQFFEKRLVSSIRALRDRLALRGTQLLAVLLASHKLSIDAAYSAFCGDSKSIKFIRFREIMHHLAPDFGDASPRTESLFLSLASDGFADLHVCTAKWHEALHKASHFLSNAHLRRVLLGKSTSTDPEDEDDPEVDQPNRQEVSGERQHLRDTFFQLMNSGVETPNILHRSRLFVNKQQLKMSLARMGVSSLSSISLSCSHSRIN